MNVFMSGTDGYHTFRIPAIVCTTQGTLLAFAEGRREHAGDAGDIDVVLRRSHDRGLMWGPLEVVLTHGSDTAGNPCPVVDPASGDVVLLTTHNLGNATEDEIKHGDGNGRRVFVQRSVDDGVTWSAAIEITADVKLPDWRWYATGPGHAISLQSGRLVAPANHSDVNSGYGAHALLSDDGGHNWRIGANDEGHSAGVSPNESTVAELPDGTLVFNARNQDRTVGHSRCRDGSNTRLQATSSDGGETFDEPYVGVPDLIAPVCQGSLLAIDGTLYFAAPSDRDSRSVFAVRKKSPEKSSWTQLDVLSTAPAAYSDLVNLGEPGRSGASGASGYDPRRSLGMGLLYETGNRSPYERIEFATVRPLQRART